VVVIVHTTLPGAIAAAEGRRPAATGDGLHRAGPFMKQLRSWTGARLQPSHVHSQRNNNRTLICVPLVVIENSFCHFYILTYAEALRKV
jgi:hypothetical protein